MGFVKTVAQTWGRRGLRRPQFLAPSREWVDPGAGVRGGRYDPGPSAFDVMCLGCAFPSIHAKPCFHLDEPNPLWLFSVVYQDEQNPQPKIRPYALSSWVSTWQHVSVVLSTRRSRVPARLQPIFGPAATSPRSAGREPLGPLTT